MLPIDTFMLEPAKLATNCVSASGSSIRRSERSRCVVLLAKGNAGEGTRTPKGLGPTGS
jgi:hypothetical protein